MFSLKRDRVHDRLCVATSVAVCVDVLCEVEVTHAPLYQSQNADGNPYIRCLSDKLKGDEDRDINFCCYEAEWLQRASVYACMQGKRMCASETSENALIYSLWCYVLSNELERKNTDTSQQMLTLEVPHQQAQISQRHSSCHTDKKEQNLDMSEI